MHNTPTFLKTIRSKNGTRKIIGNNPQMSVQPRSEYPWVGFFPGQASLAYFFFLGSLDSGSSLAEGPKRLVEKLMVGAMSETSGATLTRSPTLSATEENRSEFAEPSCSPDSRLPEERLKVDWWEFSKPVRSILDCNNVIGYIWIMLMVYTIKVNKISKRNHFFRNYCCLDHVSESADRWINILWKKVYQNNKNS